MNKNKFNIFMSLIALLMLFTISSCTDETKFTNPVTFGLGSGAFIAFDELPPTFFTPDNAQNVTISQQLIDTNNNATQYDLSFTAQLSSTGETYFVDNFITVTSFPSQLTITSQMMADAMGVDLSLFGAGDFFEFRAVVTRNDGTLYYPFEKDYDDETGSLGVGNTDDNLLNEPGYKSAMRFGYVTACPLPDTYFSGDYTFETLAVDPEGALGPIFGSNFDTIELAESSVYQRFFEGTYLADLGIGNGDVPVEITFLCGDAYTSVGQASGLQCTGPIFLSGGAAFAVDYDDVNFSDDDELIFTIVEDYAPGSACGGDVINTIRITKI